MLGQAKEMVGSGIEYATGSKEPSSWTTAGKEQHAKGEAEIKAAQAQGYAEGCVTPFYYRRCKPLNSGKAERRSAPRAPRCDGVQWLIHSVCYRHSSVLALIVQG